MKSVFSHLIATEPSYGENKFILKSLNKLKKLMIRAKIGLLIICIYQSFSESNKSKCWNRSNANAYVKGFDAVSASQMNINPQL